MAVTPGSLPSGTIPHPAAQAKGRTAGHGQYALRLTARARLIVTFTEKTATIAWIEEVSKHYGD